jgi:S1-C subfamily serine protease
VRPLGAVRPGHAAGALIAAVVALGALGACGEDDSGRAPTRVEVITGTAGGRFDPADTYRRLSPGVVTVTSLFGDGGERGLDGAGQGSGFVLDGAGHVITNAHVITERGRNGLRKATEVYVQFPDGNQVRADVVGFDPNADVGVVKVDPEGLRLVPLKLGRIATVTVGDPVAAIGSPFGEQSSLSVGVVSAKDRTIEALTEFAISDAIQTDAPINRGNSGGPLLDANGRVIGINSQIRSSTGGSVGVGFAVPVDTVRRSIAAIRADGKVRYAYVGLASQPLYPQLAERLGVPVDDGAVISEVIEDGPADKAGIRGGDREIRFQSTPVKLGGDVVTEVAGVKVTREHDFSELITRFRPGQKVELEVYRGSSKRTVPVTLGERPGNVQAP